MRKKVSKNDILKTMADYEWMMYFQDSDKASYIATRHKVSVSIKQMAGFSKDTRRKDLSVEEKQQLDAISLVFLKNYLDRGDINAVVSDFYELGYEVEE